MRLFSHFSPYLFISSRNRVFCLNYSTSEGEIKEFSVVEDTDSFIVVLQISNDCKTLYAGYSNKLICAWDVKTCSLIKSMLSKKRPTSLVFGSFHVESSNQYFVNIGENLKQVLIVGDKAGDIWGIDHALSRHPVLCGGHTTSVITDMVSHDNWVISCDRDEKIRVSKFPDMVNVKSYCLGHKDVVTSLSFMRVIGETTSLLISTSWDHQIILWNYEEGLKVGQFIHQKESSLHEVPTADAADIEEEGEGIEEKNYDEHNAGNYPIKAVAPTGGSSYLAVIYKKKQHVNLFSVHKVPVVDTFNNLEASVSALPYEIRLVATIALPEEPTDIIFLDTNELVVLLPEPHVLKAYTISFGGSVPSFCVNYEESILPKLQHFCDISNSNGVAFHRQVMLSEEGEGERGMKKHTLDRPFSNPLPDDCTKRQRCNKRSKKRGKSLNEVEELIDAEII